jgi:hypothetical protein
MVHYNLRCHLGNEDGLNKAKQKNLISSVCPKLVRDTDELIEELLAKYK